jgi:hypothetical protein
VEWVSSERRTYTCIAYDGSNIINQLPRDSLTGLESILMRAGIEARHLLTPFPSPSLPPPPRHTFPPQARTC